jgi:hypothetical protein
MPEVTTELVQGMMMPPMKGKDLAMFGSLDFDNPKDMAKFLASDDGKTLKKHIEQQLKIAGIEPNLSNVISVMTIEQHRQEAGSIADVRNFKDIAILVARAEADAKPPAVGPATKPDHSYTAYSSGSVVHNRVEAGLKIGGV